MINVAAFNCFCFKQTRQEYLIQENSSNVKR